MKPIVATLLIVTWTAGARDTRADQEQPLTLDAVLASVPSHPRQSRARAGVAEKQGALLEARGRFDPRFQAQAFGVIDGPSEHRVLSTRIVQPVPVAGIDIQAGYRLGTGQFEPYEGKDKTGDSGEVFARLNLPLLRDGSIDAARAAVASADISASIARLNQDQETLYLRRDAAHAYWTWVAAGLKQKIEKGLLALAEERTALLESSVRAGDQPKLVLIDNQRTVLKRVARVVAAEKELQVAVAKLSVYYRDSEGQPHEASLSQLPSWFPTARKLDTPIDTLVARALAARPDFLELARDKELGELVVKLAKNQRLPTLDAFVEVERELGDPATASQRRNDILVGAALDISTLFRSERGVVNKARGRLAMVAAEIQAFSENLRVEVTARRADLEAAYRQVAVARELTQASATLADAERSQFALGGSTLFLLNLRELDAADAALAEIAVMQSYFEACADIEAAIGGGDRLF